MPKHACDTQPPTPAPPPDPGSLPRPLTIFLTAEQHLRATRALRAIHNDRGRALLKALHIQSSPERPR